MAQVKVEIGGRSYRMACADGEEDALRGLAAEVDARIAALRDGVGEVGDARLAVMAAIVLADERNEARRALADAQLGARSDTDAAQAAAARIAQVESHAEILLADAAERIEALTRALRRQGSEEITGEGPPP